MAVLPAFEITWGRALGLGGGQFSVTRKQNVKRKRPSIGTPKKTSSIYTYIYSEDSQGIWYTMIINDPLPCTCLEMPARERHRFPRDRVEWLSDSASFSLQEAQRRHLYGTTSKWWSMFAPKHTFAHSYQISHHNVYGTYAFVTRGGNTLGIYSDFDNILYASIFRIFTVFPCN